MKLSKIEAIVEKQLALGGTKISIWEYPQGVWRITEYKAGREVGRQAGFRSFEDAMKAAVSLKGKLHGEDVTITNQQGKAIG